MRFAPFAFENPDLFQGLTINLWQGNYTANSTTWNNLQPYANATMATGGFGKTTNVITGLNFTGTTSTTLFTINSDGIWDALSPWTIMIYMNITSTVNKGFWHKSSSSTNGMSTAFFNNPYYALRAPTATQQVNQAAITVRGTNVYTYVADGLVGVPSASTVQYWLNKTAPAMTYVNANASTDLRWNNGFQFKFGYAAANITDPPIQGVLNRVLIWNRKLNPQEIAQAVDYCTNNA